MKMFDDFTLRISCEEYYDEDMWEYMGLKLVSTGLRKTKKFTGRKTPYVSKI